MVFISIFVRVFLFVCLGRFLVLLVLGFFVCSFGFYVFLGFFFCIFWVGFFGFVLFWLGFFLAFLFYLWSLLGVGGVFFVWFGSVFL